MKMKFRKKEKAFIAACLVLFFLLGIFLFFDVTRKFEILADRWNKIGTIIFLHNDVRLQVSADAPWRGGLQQGSRILANDTVITGTDSSADIAMNDGTLVDICEDSIMTFGRSGGDLRIAVEKGCAGVRRTGRRIRKNTRLIITDNAGEISLGSGEISIAKPQGKEPEIFVRKGEVRVSVNGDQRTIKADELAVLKTAGLSVEKKKLVLVDPSENKRFFTGKDTAHVEFAWDYRGDKTRKSDFIVQISKHCSLTPAEKRIRSSDEMIAVSLPEGNYFWRVTAENPEAGARKTSETGCFSVYRDDHFALLSPSNGESVEYKDGPPLIAFTWEPHRLAALYILELSDRSDFSKIVKRIDTRVVNFSYQWERGMKPGDRATIYWRVTATGGPGNWQGRRSDVGRFIVKRGDRLNPPRLVYPADGKSLSRSRVDKEHVIFSWEKTEDNLKRRILFSKDNGFKSLYREAPVNADAWTMKKSFPAGRYFWRVGLYDGTGKRKAVSKARAFELRDYEDLALLSPKDMSDVAVDDIEKNGLSFHWKKPEQRGRFILEMSDDGDFRKVTRAVTTESAEITVRRAAPGKYYWRVRLLNNDRTVAAASETRTLMVREGMAPPVVIFPRSGGAVKMLTENELKFSWKPMPGASAYQLELHQLVSENDKTQDKLVLSTQTNETSYTVSDLNLLDIGNFYWTLRAVKKDTRNRVVRTSKKVRNNFNINLGDSKIIIVSPEIQVIEDDKSK